MPRKIYLFAGGHKIAEGKGLVLPSDKPGAINSKPWGDANADPLQQMQKTLDDFKLREKMQMPEVSFPKEIPELSFRVKISKCRLRRLRQMAIGKKPRLPRKLKKAAKHADFDMFDLNNKIAAQQDSGNVNVTVEYNLRVRTNPAGYPRTKWVLQVAKVVLSIITRQHRRFIQHQQHQQYLDQHPGMLTYDDAPSNPAGHHKDLYAGSELVLDKNQQQRLANILNLKEK